MRRVHGIFWLPFARLHGIFLARTTILRNFAAFPVWNWEFLWWPNPQVRAETSKKQITGDGVGPHLRTLVS